ncbi:MAG: DUF5913 domain-containing protein, partial [Bacteroidota bacterium]|nr:DUF5913 domain-containing protein [Bacteroidota bacterium]
EKQHPKEDWLNYVVTAKARSKIRQSLKDERKRIADKGQHILQRKLSILKIKMTESVVQKMVNYFKVKTPTDLYYKVGMGIIDNRHLKEFTRDNSGGLYSYIKSKLPWSGAEKKGQKERGDSVGKILVFGNDDQQLDYKLAKCCNPIPGDKVFGFVTSNEGIKVHRSDCPNAISLQSKFANRTIKARWINSEQMDFTANLLIKGIDTVGLVNQVTQIISNDLSVNIRSINISGEEGVFEGNIILVVQDKIHLQGIIDKLRKVEGVTSIERKTVPARAR